MEQDGRQPGHAHLPSITDLTIGIFTVSFSAPPSCIFAQAPEDRDPSAHIQQGRK
eukprot:COSAG01_NODE_13189_length_1622_cov_9.119501_3_plen_55_part_00